MNTYCSFEHALHVKELEGEEPYNAVFIRAPAITRIGDGVRSLASVKAATSGGSFRKWEQVSNVYVTLEPFAMENGLLTQSFKVKRDFVAKRYQDEL